ncbi:DUF6049 family protein [Brachybacterium endophyticum]|uniref:DUF6049 family protein n=1 Tax=Brachybacterium endophyticum TaxID=2182385 RepID=UPI00140224CB|nr:DUF6049 family protein [Brachybacterium endophyticum]
MSEPSPPVRPNAPAGGFHDPRPTPTSVAIRAALVLLLALAPLVALPVGSASAQGSTTSAASRGQASSSSSAQSAPAAPDPADPDPASPSGSGDTELELLDGGATSLHPGETMTMKVRITNNGSTPLEDPALELRVRTDRITSRGALSTWEQQQGPDTYGVPAETVSGPSTIAPGDSADVTLSVDTDELGLSAASYLWGARRVSVTATSDDGPLTSLRTFTVWRPEGADASVRTSLLLPLTSQDPGAAVADPDASQPSTLSGRESALADLASRKDADWLLDPALLDPPQLSDKAAATSDGGSEDGDPAAPASYAQPEAAKGLADSLKDSAADHDVIGTPYGQADTAALKAAGTERLQSALEDRASSTWKDSGINPLGQATVIDGREADGDALADAVDAGADTLVVPSSSLRADPMGTVTPSSVGTFSNDGRTVPVLAPDPTLSDEISGLRQDEDPGAQRQRVIAETAVLASEQSSAPRQVLIAPEITGDTDVDAVTSTLDALDDAPWLQHAPVGDLLDAAKKDSMVTDTGASGKKLYALGDLGPGDVHPSGPEEDGTWAQLPRARTREEVDPKILRSLQKSLKDLSTVTTVAEEDAPFSATRTLILTTASQTLAGRGEVAKARAADAEKQVASLRGAIHVDPASGYNLVSDSAGVPITVTNELDSPITVQVAVSTDRPIVRVGEPTTVSVPARQKKEVTVPIDAIANGTVTLTSTVRSEDGTRLDDPVSVPLNVNPAWENWTTLVLVGALGGLVVVGVLRARRTGSRRRADELDDTGESAVADATDEEKA